MQPQSKNSDSKKYNQQQQLLQQQKFSCKTPGTTKYYNSTTRSTTASASVSGSASASGPGISFSASTTTAAVTQAGGGSASGTTAPSAASVLGGSPSSSVKIIKSKKPLCQFKFYLDICDHQITKRIEDQIKLLGGVLEFFLTASVTHFITDKTDLLNFQQNQQQQQQHQQKQQNFNSNNSRPATPQTPATPGTPQTPYSIESYDGKLGQATPVGTKRTRTSRADAILSRARKQTSNTTSSVASIVTAAAPVPGIGLISFAGAGTSSANALLKTQIHHTQHNNNNHHNNLQHSYIIWQTEHALRFFKKVQYELRDYLDTPKDNKSKLLSKSLQVEPIPLKGNYIKIEPIKRHYRPYYHLIKKPTEWPKIELHRDDGAFRLSPKKPLEDYSKQIIANLNNNNNNNNNNSNKMTRKSRSRSSQHRPLPANVQALKKTALEGSPKASTGNNVAARNSKVNANAKDLKESSDKQCGVCEICKVEYDVLSVHLKSKEHEYFAKNSQNFVALDGLINSSADVNKFLEETKKMELEEMEVDEEINLENVEEMDPLKNPTPTMHLNESQRHSSALYKTPSPTLREKSKRSTKGKHSSEKFQKTDKTAANLLVSQWNAATATATTTTTAISPEDSPPTTAGTGAAIVVKSETEKKKSSLDLLNLDLKKVNSLSLVSTTRRKPSSSALALSPPIRPMLPQSPLYKVVETPEMRTPKRKGRFGTGADGYGIESPSLIVKFQKVRQSELDRLNGEAENFMFRKQPSSSELPTDQDRQTSSDNAARIRMSSAFLDSTSDMVDLDIENQEELPPPPPSTMGRKAKAKGKRRKGSIQQNKSKQYFPSAPIQPEEQLKQTACTKLNSNDKNEAKEEAISLKPPGTTTTTTITTKTLNFALPEATRKSSRTATAIVTAATTSSRLLQAAVEAAKHNNRKRAIDNNKEKSLDSLKDVNDGKDLLCTDSSKRNFNPNAPAGATATATATTTTAAASSSSLSVRTRRSIVKLEDRMGDELTSTTNPNQHSFTNTRNINVASNSNSNSTISNHKLSSSKLLLQKSKLNLLTDVKTNLNPGSVVTMEDFELDFDDYDDVDSDDIHDEDFRMRKSRRLKSVNSPAANSLITTRRSLRPTNRNISIKQEILSEPEDEMEAEEEEPQAENEDFLNHLKEESLMKTNHFQENGRKAQKVPFSMSATQTPTATATITTAASSSTKVETFVRRTARTPKSTLVPSPLASATTTTSTASSTVTSMTVTRASSAAASKAFTDSSARRRTRCAPKDNDSFYYEPTLEEVLNVSRMEKKAKKSLEKPIKKEPLDCTSPPPPASRSTTPALQSSSRKTKKSSTVAKEKLTTNKAQKQQETKKEKSPDKNDSNSSSSPEKAQTTPPSLIPLFDYTKSQHINKSLYSFERLPIADVWYKVFTRQDESKERFCEYFGSTKYRKLPYELGPIPFDITTLHVNCKLCAYEAAQKAAKEAKVSQAKETTTEPLPLPPASSSSSTSTTTTATSFKEEKDQEGIEKTENQKQELKEEEKPSPEVKVEKDSISSKSEETLNSAGSTPYLHRHKKLHLLQRYRKELQELNEKEKEKEQDHQESSSSLENVQENLSNSSENLEVPTAQPLENNSEEKSNISVVDSPLDNQPSTSSSININSFAPNNINNNNNNNSSSLEVTRKCDSKASTPDLENSIIMDHHLASRKARAGSSHSTASSCASSSATLNKKPFRNKHLNKAALSLELPPRKSPREHASTLALVSCLIRQRQDSLSKTNSETDEPPLTPTTPQSPSHKMESDLEALKKPEEQLEDFEQMINIKQEKIETVEGLEERLKPSVTKEEEPEDEKVVVAVKESLKDSEKFQSIAAPLVVKDNKPEIVPLTPRPTRSSAATPIGEEVRYATEISETVKRMRRGQNKFEVPSSSYGRASSSTSAKLPSSLTSFSKATSVGSSSSSSLSKNSSSILQQILQTEQPKKRGRPPKNKSAILAQMNNSILPFKRRASLLGNQFPERNNNSNRSIPPMPNKNKKMRGYGRWQHHLSKNINNNNAYTGYGLPPSIRKTGSKKGVLEYEADVSALKALELATKHESVRHLEWEIEKYLELSCKDVDIAIDIYNNYESGIDTNDETEPSQTLASLDKSCSATASPSLVESSQQEPHHQHQQQHNHPQTPPATDYFSSDFDLCDLINPNSNLTSAGGVGSSYGGPPSDSKNPGFSLYSAVAFENYFRKKRVQKKNRTGWPNTQRKKFATRDQQKRTSFLGALEQSKNNHSTNKESALNEEEAGNGEDDEEEENHHDKEEKLNSSRGNGGGGDGNNSGVITPPDSDAEEEPEDEEADENNKPPTGTNNLEDLVEENPNSLEINMAEESIPDDEEEEAERANNETFNPETEAAHVERRGAEAEAEDNLDDEEPEEADEEDDLEEEEEEEEEEEDNEDLDDNDGDTMADSIDDGNTKDNIDAEESENEEADNEEEEADNEEEEEEENDNDEDDDDDDLDDDFEDALDDHPSTAASLKHKLKLVSEVQDEDAADGFDDDVLPLCKRRRLSEDDSPSDRMHNSLMSANSTAASTPTNHLLRHLRRTPQLNGSLGSCISPSDKAGDNSDIFTVSSDGLETDLDLSNPHAHSRTADEDSSQGCPHQMAAAASSEGASPTGLNNSSSLTPKRKLDITKYAPKNSASSCAAEAATAAVKSLAISQFLKKEVRVTCRRLRAPFRRFRFRR